MPKLPDAQQVPLRGRCLCTNGLYMEYTVRRIFPSSDGSAVNALCNTRRTGFALGAEIREPNILV